ncbi:MAG: potassium channel protein [Candidatus Promineifilaceae bacterium]|nr:potassium channel protein [Candidatus Promineifilaceae bacterium]
MRSLQNRLLIFFGGLLAVLALGTGWYYVVESWSVLDSLYMTVITLTTVGFGEIHPLSPRSRLFTILLILLGVSTVAYGFGSLGEYILTSGVLERWQKRGTMRAIKKLDNHIIVCGAGRVGQTAAAALFDMGRACVLVENDQAVLDEIARHDGWVVLEGDATRDETLLEAGIERADGLLVCTGSDSNNLFIVLSARALSADLFIVARGVEAGNEPKMRRAGADKVISPYQIGGRHMANVAVRPHVTEFLDVVTLDSGLELWLEEVMIRESSPLAGLTVVEADLRRRTGVSLIALLRGEEKEMLTPDESSRFMVGDELIVLGTRQQLSEMEKLIGVEIGHRRSVQDRKL